MRAGRARAGQVGHKKGRARAGQGRAGQGRAEQGQQGRARSGHGSSKQAGGLSGQGSGQAGFRSLLKAPGRLLNALDPLKGNFMIEPQ